MLARVVALHDGAALSEADSAASAAIDAARRAGDDATARPLVLRRALILADMGRLADAFVLVLPLADAPSGRDDGWFRTVATLHLRRAAGHAALEVLNSETDVVSQTAGDAARDGTRAEDGAIGLAPRPVLRGLALIADGDVGAGTRALEDWLEQVTEDGPVAPGAVIDARLGLGHAALDRGDVAAASRQVTAALSLARTEGHRLRQAEVLLLEGRRARLVGATEQAETAFRDALAVARVAPLPRVTAAAAHALFEISAARGTTAEALEFLRLHTDARLALTAEAGTDRLVDVLVRVAQTTRTHATSPPASADAPPTSGATGVVDGTDTMRLLMLGISLGALILAAVLWRVVYIRGQRTLHYRQELETLKGAITRGVSIDGLITICASCKDVCSEDGAWSRVEAYLAAHTGARFTHSICPTCEQRVLADVEGLGAAERQGATMTTDDGPPLQGGFDWPPSLDEMARVVRAAAAGQDPAAAPRGGRWG